MFKHKWQCLTYPDWTLIAKEGLEREKGNLKKIIEENEARFRLLGTQPTKKKKKKKLAN